MPYPPDFETASRDFDRFLDLLKVEADVGTRHQAFQIAHAVFRVFRDHLSIADALLFADALPPLLRAMFVEDWQPVADPPPFPEREQLVAEVLAVRADHSFAGQHSIAHVARCLGMVGDANRLSLALSSLPESARQFWKVRS